MLLKDQAAVVSFDMIVERLVEAWGFLRRMPDPEARWLRDKGTSAVFGQPMTIREVWREWGFDAAMEVQKAAASAPPSVPGLRSAEVDRMNEALGWIEWVEPRDRRLVGLVLRQLDRGAARPAWKALAHDLGWAGDPDTLAKRWSRAVSRIAFKVNA